MKLVVREPESAALRRYLRRRRPLISSALALVYEVTPTAAFGFGKGKFSQTRWRF